MNLQIQSFFSLFQNVISDCSPKPEDHFDAMRTKICVWLIPYFYCIEEWNTAWKISLFGVFLVRIFPQSNWNRTRKNPNTENFHAVLPVLWFFFFFFFFLWSLLVNIIKIRKALNETTSYWKVCEIVKCIFNFFIFLAKLIFNQS